MLLETIATTVAIAITTTIITIAIVITAEKKIIC